MAYTPQTWADGSAGGTPVSAARLSHIESGVQAAATTADSALPTSTAATAYVASGAPVVDAPGLGLYFPEAHGAVGNGTTDDSAAIQAAMNAAKAANGGVVACANKTYAIATGLTGAKNVLLRGAGADWGHTTGVAAGATVFKALTASMTMVSYAMTTSSGADQAGSGGGVQGIFFDAGAGAAVGLEVRSWRYGLFDWLGFGGAFSTVGLYTGTVAQTAGADDNRGVQNCIFSRIDVNVTGSSDGIILDGDTSVLTNPSNTSINTFDSITVNHVNGTGLHLKNSDNNTFINVRTFRTGAGTGLWMRGAGYSGGECRGNTFVRFTSNSSPTVEGTGTATVAAHDNVFYGWDQENSTPAPTLGTGATLHWIDSSGVLNSMTAFGLTVADSRAAALANPPGASSLVVYNGSASNIMLMDSARTAKLYVDANGPDLSRVSGGAYTSLERNIKATATGVGFYGTTPVAKPTITGSRGANAALASLLTALAAQGLITDSST